MKKILLLGDSIRLGYQPYVQQLLADEVQVVGPEENGRFSKYTLWAVNLWIKELGKPDLIQFNNGLWDLHHEEPMVEALTSLEEYLDNMSRIVNELERTGAKLIFATTIPVLPDAVGRSNAEIDRYNAAAIRLMKSKGIVINDLNSLLKLEIANYVCEDRLHLTDEGYQRCADQTANLIRQYLEL